MRRILKLCEICKSPVRSRRITAKYCSRQCAGKAKEIKAGTIKERLQRNSVLMPNGCIEWTGVLTPAGYGRMTIRNHPTFPGHSISTHKAAYIEEYGPVPDDLCVCHKCDNPKCINTEHLFLGTSIDNNLDRDRKNRTMHGSKHHKAKLSESEVLEIRELYKNRIINNTEIAIHYRVSQRTIESIIYNGGWKHL